MADVKDRLSEEGFNQKEVDIILQRAAELQTQTDLPGTRMERGDLEAGAEAAGINRAFIDQAIREMKTERDAQALQQAKRSRLIKFIVGIGIAVLAIWIISANYILNSRLAFAEEKQAQLENVLQRRHDLIPNLINVAKASAAHEKELIASVGDLYQKLDEAGNFTERQTIEQDLEASVKKLMSALQADPEASSTALFIRLSDEMAGAENRISVERKRYNEAAAIYNRAARGLFVGSMGRLFGYPGEMPYFQASEEASKPPSF